MAGHKSPLRDRLLSNSPDPIKSSILRESGMGWNSPPSNQDGITTGSIGSITSPLRIAKRDSPSRALPQPQIARRTSSSYKHVRNNNLVSKSPFKSQIHSPLLNSSHHPPIHFPTSRRVSGEKRPRPSSMHEQAETENERPFSLKRERRQSKGFQGLIQKEPVTKSPFKQRTPSAEEHPPVPIPKLTALSSTVQNRISSISDGASPARIIGSSPARSSLVSRRMHGPRLSGGGRRERRKTVTFDERCDVVEFDREEETDEEMFGGAAEEDDSHPEYESHEDEVALYHDRPFEDDASPHHHGLPYESEHDSSYESIQLSDMAVDSHNDSSLLGTALDPDTSISGLVDEMFFSSSDPTYTNNPISELHRVDAPGTRDSPNQAVSRDIPTDMDAFDGIAFERPPPHQSSSRQPSPFSTPSRSFTLPEHSTTTLSLSTPSSPASSAIPPRRLPVPSPSPTGTDLRHSAITSETSRRSPALSFVSSPSPSHSRQHTPPLFFNRTPPIRHSPYSERVSKAKSEEDSIGVDTLSEDPPRTQYIDRCEPESWVTRNGTETEAGISSAGNEAPYPQSELPISDEGGSNGSLDPMNLSIGGSEVGADVLRTGNMREQRQFAPHDEDTSGNEMGSRSPLLTDAGTGSANHHDKTLFLNRTSTPPLELSTGGTIRNFSDADVGSRPRINKEEVKRRLLRNRQSFEPQEYTDAVPSDSGVPDEWDKSEEDREEKDRLSVVTTMTDLSAETATIERAQKLKMTGVNVGEEKGIGIDVLHQRLQFDFGGKFGLGGLGIGSLDGNKGGSVGSRDSMGILHPDASSEASGSVKSGGSMKMGMGEVDVDMDMRSALDRLMDDVAGARADDSMVTDDRDSFVQGEPQKFTSMRQQRQPIERAATDTALLHNNFSSRNSSGASTSIPPPVPPKDNIRSREQLIIEKRREAKRMEESESLGYYTPPKAFGGRSAGQALLGVGRPSRRRSMSTGDVNAREKQRDTILLDVAGVGDGSPGDDALADSIDKELKRLVKDPPKSKYNIREREGTIYASSSDPDHISHVAGPGDLNVGKAWRTVRRPSDMNEYSKEIKEYRAQEKPGKAYGKVFVKVLGVKGMHLPLPQQPTALTCTLNNGIHFVSTPEFPLGRDCRIEQEFELIEHSKLEFTLTLKVRRDPHIVAQFKSIAPIPPPPPPPVVQTSSKGGMRSFFYSSPKKASKDKLGVPTQIQPPVQPQRLVENLARYLKSDGTLARAFISFKDVAFRCDTRLFETSYPLIGQRVEPGGKLSTLQVGEIVLQMFRLPPLPGISPEQLPQSLEECHRGLRHINWHKVTYFEGTLTQSGGDCSTWRRRQLRVIGANLVAFNDVTKKATATIDLKKALAVEDDQEPRRTALSSASRSKRYTDDYDGLGGVERSFRLIFPHDQEIIFFADTDEEKSRWLDVLRALVGHIPPHPLWAELLWQRQDDLSRKAQFTTGPSHNVPRSSSPHPVSRSPYR